VVVEVEAEGEMSIRDPFEVLDIQAFSPEEIPIGSLSHDHDYQLQNYFSGLTTLE
jgi:hypothetical protein